MNTVWINTYQELEIDLEYADTSGVEVIVNGGGASYGGTIMHETDLEIELPIEELCLSVEQIENLAAAEGFVLQRSGEVELSEVYASKLVDELIDRNLCQEDTLRIIRRLAEAGYTNE